MYHTCFIRKNDYRGRVIDRGVVCDVSNGRLVFFLHRREVVTSLSRNPPQRFLSDQSDAKTSLPTKVIKVRTVSSRCCDGSESFHRNSLIAIAQKARVPGSGFACLCNVPSEQKESACYSSCIHTNTSILIVPNNNSQNFENFCLFVCFAIKNSRTVFSVCDVRIM